MRAAKVSRGRQFIKDDASTVRRPLRRTRRHASGCQPAEPFAIRLNHVDAQFLRVLPTRRRLDVRLERKIPIGRERDPLAVWRPRRPEEPVQLACFAPEPIARRSDSVRDASSSRESRCLPSGRRASRQTQPDRRQETPPPGRRDRDRRSGVRGPSRPGARDRDRPGQTRRVRM